MPLMESVRALWMHSSSRAEHVPPSEIQRFPSPRSNPTFLSTASWLVPPRNFYQPPTHLKSPPSTSGNHFEPLRHSERNYVSSEGMKTSHLLRLN